MNNCGVLEDLESHEESPRSLEVLVLVGAGTRDKRHRRSPPNAPHLEGHYYIEASIKTSSGLDDEFQLILIETLTR